MDAAFLPLASIGPSGLGGEYQRDEKGRTIEPAPAPAPVAVAEPDDDDDPRVDDDTVRGIRERDSRRVPLRRRTWPASPASEEAHRRQNSDDKACERLRAMLWAVQDEGQDGFPEVADLTEQIRRRIRNLDPHCCPKCSGELDAEDATNHDGTLVLPEGRHMEVACEHCDFSQRVDMHESLDV